MANYVITINVDAARRESVEKKLKLAFGADIPVHTIEKVKTAESRADRFSDAEGMADQARQIVEELKDEMALESSRERNGASSPCLKVGVSAPKI